MVPHLSKWTVKALTQTMWLLRAIHSLALSMLTLTTLYSHRTSQQHNSDSITTGVVATILQTHIKVIPIVVVRLITQEEMVAAAIHSWTELVVTLLNPLIILLILNKPIPGTILHQIIIFPIKITTHQALTPIHLQTTATTIVITIRTEIHSLPQVVIRITIHLWADSLLWTQALETITTTTLRIPTSIGWILLAIMMVDLH